MSARRVDGSPMAAALQHDEVERVRPILERRSIWMGHSESQSQWNLLRAAVALVQAVEDAELQLPGHLRSQSALLDFYVGHLREVDRLRRDFEQTAAGPVDLAPELADIVAQARRSYRSRRLVMGEVLLTTYIGPRGA